MSLVYNPGKEIYIGAACALGFTVPRKLSPVYWKVTVLLGNEVSSGSVVIAGRSSHTSWMVTTLPPIKTFAHFQEEKNPFSTFRERKVWKFDAFWVMIGGKMTGDIHLHKTVAA